MENNDNAPHDVSFHFISINFNLFHLCNKIVKAWHACVYVRVSVWVPLCLVHRQDAHEMSGHLKNARKCQENIISSAAQICYKFINFVSLCCSQCCPEHCTDSHDEVSGICEPGAGEELERSLDIYVSYIFIFCKSFGCQKLENINNISLTPTSKLSHASPKGPECRLCPALLFEGLFSRCDLSSVNGHSEVAVRSFSKSCESSVPRCQEEHVIRTQSRGKTLVPPSGLTTQKGKPWVPQKWNVLHLGVTPKGLN